MSSDAQATQWEQLADDPDLEEDLGYFLLELDVITTATNENTVVILPKDEELLKEDAFMVADKSDICELADHT